MRVPDRRPARGIAWVHACIGALTLAVAAARADDVAYRYSAPVEVQQSAPFVRLPLPASAYGRTEQAELRDLRIVDSAGERVPFGLLLPRASATESTEHERDVKLFPLPARPASGQAWPAPVEVTVQGDRISVRQSPSAASKPAKNSPGWLFDLGDARERARDEPPAQSLRLHWSGPVEFSAGFDLETSDDLRRWRAGGAGQVLALQSPTGPLLQPSVMLPATSGRFVRLVWSDPGAAPALSGATAIGARQRSIAVDPPTELVIAPSPEPLRKNDDEVGTALAKRTLHFDLGGVLPLVQVDLQIGSQAGSGTRVVPVRLQARNRADEAWRDVAGHVFYRIERAGAINVSPPLGLQATLRYLRVIPDERTAPLDAAQARLVVQAQLASLVFATQGRAPYTLLAGAAKAPVGALPIATLVPALDDERARLGRATLGAWSESESVLRQVQSQQRVAALRPWLLWAVLIAGVAGLGFMVWRLARTGPAQ